MIMIRPDQSSLALPVFQHPTTGSTNDVKSFAYDAEHSLPKIQEYLPNLKYFVGDCAAASFLTAFFCQLVGISLITRLPDNLSVVRTAFDNAYDGKIELRSFEITPATDTEPAVTVQLAEVGDYSFTNRNGVEHNGGGNYANIPNGTVEYLGGVYQNYNTKMELDSTSGLTVVSNTYTLYTEVAFDANGGSGTPSTPVTNTTTSDASDDLTDISMQIPTTILTRDGYIFKGYSYTSSGSLVLTKAEVEAGASLDVPAGMEVTLYAQWEELSYTVNFLRSEGEVIDSVSVKGGQTVPVPEEPTAPDGYFFVGWYTDNTHSTPFDFSKPINQDTNVYAYFQEELYFTSEPQALYTVTKIAGVDNTYVFQVLEESNSTTVHWDFGDGNTSDKRFVSHYFDEPGTYSVTLTVYNSQGEATDTFDVVIPAEDEDGLGLLLYVAVGLIAVVIVVVVVTRFV